MAKKVIELKIFNEGTSEFEHGDIITGANAVEMGDGPTLEEKTAVFETKIDALEKKEAGAAATIISETPPENPYNGQIWFSPVAVPGEDE